MNTQINSRNTYDFLLTIGKNYIIYNLFLPSNNETHFLFNLTFFSFPFIFKPFQHGIVSYKSLNKKKNCLSSSRRTLL